MDSILLITGLFIISSTGLVIHLWREIPERLLHLLVALGGGTMLSVALVHILPESLETNPVAIYAFIGGFIAIYLIEELLTPHHHDHTHGDHTHEDPHEHLHHVIIVSWIAILLHTIFDGVGIRAGMSLSPVLGVSILTGVAIHQIPVSLSLASLLRQSHFQIKTQIILLLIFAFAAPLGYLLSDIFIPSKNIFFVGLLTAFAGGSLLYVSNVEFLPMIHAQSSRKMKYITMALFIVGVVGMSLVKVLE
ncbi:MAG: ZIP family metal transporter [Candidatus Gracilibacteria bacterium]